MKRTNITIAILAAVFALNSCKPSYTCHCKVDTDSNAHGNQPAFYDKDIKAKDRAQAAVQCTRLDPNCSVK